ncbi:MULTISPECIES: major tail protein [Bacillus]|uniref:major tail protein n=1 Tax=Bacillus TaxID=1386 RepID=UPI0002F03599|nr:MULTISPECIES: major tail protein [Bacillus]
MPENKVTFGLSNVHYAVITEGDAGVYTYATPVAIPGAVELTTDPAGESSSFFADNRVYYEASSNQGYEGTISFAKLPQSFRVDVLGETVVNGGLAENANAKIKRIALLFEIDADIKADRFVYYDVTVSRPGNSSKTKEDSTEVNTVELNFKATPRPDGWIKFVTGDTTPVSVYDAFYNAVTEPIDEVVGG